MLFLHINRIAFHNIFHEDAMAFHTFSRRNFSVLY